MNVNSPNYYSVLGVTQDASPEEIQAAARRLSQKFPEEAQDPSTNAAYMQLIRAYEVLSNPDHRAAYDEILAQSGFDVLGIELLPSRRTLGTLEREQLLYLLVNVFAPPGEEQQRLPINLCLVFDRSTSMQLERLQRVKAAARQVIESLSGEDIISVVTFSDRAEVVIPASHVGDKGLLITSINKMTAGGGTEIYQGLRAGVRELGKAPLASYVNNLVLMTDGQTYGDEDDCLQLAQAVGSKGISISAFGIGTDWNDVFLDQLVSPTGGHSAYIESPDQIISHLRRRIERLGAIYAQDLHLSFNLPAGVNCREIFKVAPFAQPLDCPKGQLNLGAVESGLSLSILLEFGVRIKQRRGQLPLTFEFQATIPSRRMRQRRFQRTLSIKIVPGDTELSPPRQVLQAVQMLNLHRMNEKAWEELQAGETNKATRRMQRLTSRLMESGHEELAERALVETQRLAHLGTLSPEGRKKLKFRNALADHQNDPITKR